MTRLTWLFRRRAADTDLAREIDAHIAERVDDLVEGGMDEAAARAQARREFGNARLQVERSREVWIAPWLTSVGQDLRYAARSLARAPGFTLSAVGILAVGIGLVTALFNVVNGFVLRPWDVHDPSSLTLVVPRPATGGVPSGLLSSPEYRYLREHSRSFTHLASWTHGESPIRGGPVTYGDTTTSAESIFVTANYFDTLGIGIQVGRTFRAEEENYGTPHAVAIISDRLWRDYFGASEAILGGTIRVREHPFTVVGVATQGFRGPDVGIPIDLWLPVTSVALLHSAAPGNDWLQRLADPTSSRSSVVGRLKPGIAQAEAEAELTALSRQFRTALSMEPYGISLYDTRLITALRVNANQFRGPLAAVSLVFGALFLVMLLACANTGNLILARGLSRQREIAIRLSLGASRVRVVRQLLTESLVIAVAAGAVAVWVASLVPGYFSHVFTKPERFSPDVLVFGFASIMATIACVTSGVMPALSTTRMNLAARASERNAGRAGAGRLRTTLLAAQLALSMVLLIGAGLLTRTLSHIATFDPGFAIHEVQAIGIRLPGDTSTEQRAMFTRTLRGMLDVDDLPAVAFSEFTPIATAQRIEALRRDGESRDMNRTIVAPAVSARFFSVLGIPLMAGRSLSDDEGSHEVVVNESAARLFWPGVSAIGQRLVGGEGDGTQFHDVVGVVKDVSVVSLTGTQPVVYQPIRSAGILLVRDLSPAMADQVASIVRGIEPQAHITSRPLSDDLAAIASSPEWQAARGVAWAIALLALTLATVGAFGVFAYMVEERRREIGVRMALGAQTRQVVWTVVGGARRPLAFGLSAGLLLSFAVGPLLGRFLYGLSPFDPITYLGISAILVVAALVATWIPARRAARIDPAVTLRSE